MTTDIGLEGKSLAERDSEPGKVSARQVDNKHTPNIQFFIFLCIWIPSCPGFYLFGKVFPKACDGWTFFRVAERWLYDLLKGFPVGSKSGSKSYLAMSLA
jgi:hypothetical protein